MHGVSRLYSMDSVANTRMRKLARDLGFREQTDPDDPTQVICYLDLGTANPAVETLEPGAGKRYVGIKSKIRRTQHEEI